MHTADSFGNKKENKKRRHDLFQILINRVFFFVVMIRLVKKDKKIMQKMGLEPTRYCYHRHLKPARLPIPPLLHFSYESIAHLRLLIYNNRYMHKSQAQILNFLNFFLNTKKTYNKQNNSHRINIFCLL